MLNFINLFHTQPLFVYFQYSPSSNFYRKNLKTFCKIQTWITRLEDKHIDFDHPDGA